LQELNTHLPFGDHLMGNFFVFFYNKKWFSTFFILYPIDEGVQMNGFSFQFKIKRGMLENIRGLSN
jgi:hypothetical protein